LIVQRHLTVAVAESLTGGMLSTRFAQAPGASEWFRGGIVAYATEVKHDLLGIRPGPVVSRQAAIDMVDGVSKLLDASVAIAVTGVGGPGPQDDQPPGTVWVGVLTEGHAQAFSSSLPVRRQRSVDGSVTVAWTCCTNGWSADIVSG
jgi:PncC family amidohydrolase